MLQLHNVYTFAHISFLSDHSKCKALVYTIYHSYNRHSYPVITSFGICFLSHYEMVK